MFVQRLRAELDQARHNLAEATKRRENPLAAAEEAKHSLTHAERFPRPVADDLKVPLEDASLRACDKEEAKIPSLKGVLASKPQQPLPSSVPRVSAGQEPDAMVEDLATKTDEIPQRSIGDTSDATSHGLVDELMQKLTEETSQRRSARQATGEKVRHSEIETFVAFFTHPQVYELPPICPSIWFLGHRYPHSSLENRQTLFAIAEGCGSACVKADASIPRIVLQ